MMVDGNSKVGEGKVFATRKEYQQAKKIEYLENRIDELEEFVKGCIDFCRSSTSCPESILSIQARKLLCIE